MSFKKILRRFVLLIAPIFIIAGLGWSLRYESDFFLIEKVPVEVEFSGEQSALVLHLKPEFEKSLLTLKGQNIWRVGLSKIRSQLMENSWIEEVEIRRQFPREISALIKLKEISFLYVDRKNKIHPITVTGERLKVTQPNVAPPSPILRNNKIMKDPKLLQKVVSGLSEVPNLGALRKENIASVDFNPTTGLSLRLIDGNELVHLGEKNISTKGLQVLRVTDYLKSQKQKARVIDATFNQKVLVRLRKRS